MPSLTSQHPANLYVSVYSTARNMTTVRATYLNPQPRADPWLLSVAEAFSVMALWTTAVLAIAGSDVPWCHLYQFLPQVLSILPCTNLHLLSPQLEPCHLLPCHSDVPAQILPKQPSFQAE